MIRKEVKGHLQCVIHRGSKGYEVSLVHKEHLDFRWGDFGTWIYYVHPIY